MNWHLYDAIFNVILAIGFYAVLTGVLFLLGAWIVANVSDKARATWRRRSR